MQDWNVLHAARWKCRPKKSPSGHHHTTMSGYIFVTKARIDNRKKFLKEQCITHMSQQYGELWPTSGCDRFGSLGHPSKFQRLSRLGSVTARHSGSGRQANFVALNRRRHLYSAGRPSRWALAHILVCAYFAAGEGCKVIAISTSVCPCAYIKSTCLNFMKFSVPVILPVAIGRSSDDNAIRYVGYSRF